MYSSSQQMPIRPDELSAQVPSTMHYVRQNDSSNAARDGLENGTFSISQAEQVANPSKGFASLNEIMMWVKNMGRSIGYVIVTRRSKLSKKGFVRKVNMMCDRGGVYREKCSTRNTSSKKINCPFELVCYHDRFDKLWKLRVKCETHNHEPAHNMEGHPYAMRLSSKEQELVAELSKLHMKPRDILSIVKAQNPDNVSSLKSVYNARQKLRRRNTMKVQNLDNVHNLNHDQQPSTSMHNEYFNQEPIIKNLENDMMLLGKNIKQHEENINLLKAHKNSLDVAIADMQVTLGKYHLPNAPKIEDGDLSHIQSEEETVANIMKHEKSAAAILCQLARHRNQDPIMKDVLGVVATLGKVTDGNLSRILSAYLGLDNMLGIVCMTYDGLEALESYDKEGCIDKNAGLYGLATATGHTLEGHFNVICLENLRPYVGEVMANDPQRKLALLKPRLPNGETPAGFIEFAVNMIHIDKAHLRETLFYTLFSGAQVYRTKREMLQALPCIHDGAMSLDGAFIRSNGVCVLGLWDDIDVKFAITSRVNYVPEEYVEFEKQIKEMKWKRDRMMEDIKREETMLAHVKYDFEVKKHEFLGFMAQSSPYTKQFPMQAVKQEKL